MAAYSPSPNLSARTLEFLEWGLVVLLACSLAWTTLCLGGYRPETMVATSAINLGVAVLCCVLAAAGAGRPWNRAALWPLPFLVYALANALWVSPVGWLAWREWLLWLQMWVVFAAVLHFGRSRRQTRVLVGLALALAVVSTAMAAYQRFVDWEWLMLGRKQLEQYRGRATGSFGIPNSLAAFLELVFLPCVAVALARGADRRWRIAWTVLAAVCAGGLVLSVSRGAMIAMALAALLWPAVAGGAWRQRLRGALLAAMLVGVSFGGLCFAVPKVRERLDPFLHGRWEASRPVMWRVAGQIFQEHPWLGSGAASYNVVFERHRPAGFGVEPQWTHNEYLNTLSDYGAVGFALFFAGGAGLLWSAGRKIRSAAAAPSGGPADVALVGNAWRLGAFLGVVAFALHLLVDFHLKIPALAFWVAVAVGLLLREAPAASRREVLGGVGRWGWLAAAGAVVFFGITAVVPVYRSEALRYGMRRLIDENAREGKGELRPLVARAEENIGRATVIDPANAQAWADLAYAKSLGANLHPNLTTGELVRLGAEAEKAARRATELSAAVPESWVRLGIALDMQGRHDESDPFFRRCLQLAPRIGNFWFYYAFHLSGIPGSEAPARAALATCLELDGGNAAALALREQLSGRK